MNRQINTNIVKPMNQGIGSNTDTNAIKNRHTPRPYEEVCKINTAIYEYVKTRAGIGHDAITDKLSKKSHTVSTQNQGLTQDPNCELNN